MTELENHRFASPNETTDSRALDSHIVSKYCLTDYLLVSRRKNELDEGEIRKSPLN